MEFLMFKWFSNKKSTEPEQSVSVWKEDFSDCVTADYLPSYSVCQTESRSKCRYCVRYEGMILCSHPDHKRYIPEGSEPFIPQTFVGI